MTNISVLIVSGEEKCKILENIKYTSEDKVNKDIDLILEWFQKEQHLPRIKLDRRQVRNILVSRKGSVEQTKQKIDLMYSLRNFIPEMSAPRDIRNPCISKVLKACSYYILPKLNHDLTRVSVVTFKDSDSSFFNSIDFVNYFFMTVEYRLLNDCFAGDRYILNLEGLALGHITKITPSLVKNSETFVRKAYGMRIFGVHIINASSLLNTLLSILKAGFSDKLKSRIYIHPNLEDLYKTIDQNILPVEFGGKERSEADLIESWKQELDKEDVRSHLIAQETIKSNEALRIGGRLDDEILGVAGSFKKLDVD